MGSKVETVNLVVFRLYNYTKLTYECSIPFARFQRRNTNFSLWSDAKEPFNWAAKTCRNQKRQRQKVSTVEIQNHSRNETKQCWFDYKVQQLR